MLVSSVNLLLKKKVDVANGVDVELFSKLPDTIIMWKV